MAIRRDSHSCRILIGNGVGARHTSDLQILDVNDNLLVRLIEVVNPCDYRTLARKSDRGVLLSFSVDFIRGIQYDLPSIGEIPNRRRPVDAAKNSQLPAAGRGRYKTAAVARPANVLMES